MQAPAHGAGGRSTAAALCALLLGTYAYFYQAGGWNQNSRFDLVRAMVEDGRLTIDRFEKNTGDDSIRDGHHYCDKAPGSSWLCTPTYAVAYWLAGAPAKPSPTWLAWAVWLSIVIAVGVPSAIAAVFLARLARQLGIDGWRPIAIALAWGLATLGLPYSTLLYGNQIAASCLIIAFALLVEIRRGGAAPTAVRMFAVGALLGLSAATEYPAMLVVIPISAYGLIVLGATKHRDDAHPVEAPARGAGRARQWRALAWAAMGGALPLAALAAYHWVAFGSPSTFPYKYSVWKEPSTGVFMGIGAIHGDRLESTFFGEYRGLLWATPWLALAIPGTIALARRYTAEVVVCLWAVIAFVWLNASIKPWHGGWATGPRYVVPMLPFLVLLAGGVLPWLRWPSKAATRLALRRGSAAFAAAILAMLVAWSAAHMFAATAVKPELDNHIKRPYHQVVWPRFRRGELSISTQSIDMAANPAKAPRQAWNLGMKAGLDGHASLVPLVLWWLLTAAWLARAARRGPGKT